MILQPSRSPKNVTFEPTTGPRSIRTGDSRDVRLARNFRSALVGNVWPASASGGGRSRRLVSFFAARIPEQLAHLLRLLRLLLSDRLRRRHWLRLRLRPGAGPRRPCPCCAMSTLPRKCAPSAIATRGEVMSPSTDPFSRMSTFSLALTLPMTSPRTTTDLANNSALILPFGPIVST